MANEAISTREPRPDVVIEGQLQGVNRTIQLKKDLTVKMYLVDRAIFSAHNLDVMCFGYGDTEEEALMEFARLFDLIWGFLEPKSDDELHRNARTIRVAYASFIREAGE